MQFEDHIVAFADVLGASAATMERGSAEVFGKRLATAHKLIAQEVGGFGSARDRISMRFFSDSIIMASPLEHPDNMAKVLNRLAMCQAILAVNGLFLRGGVDVGPYLQNDTVDFGAPLVRAVRIEKEFAKDTAKICLSHKLRVFGRNFEFNTLLDAADGTVFLDFLSCLHSKAYIRRLRQRIEEGLKQASNKLEEAIEEEKKPAEKVVAKLTWLANYYNHHFERHVPIDCSTDNYGPDRFQRNFAQ